MQFPPIFCNLSADTIIALNCPSFQNNKIFISVVPQPIKFIYIYLCVRMVFYYNMYPNIKFLVPEKIDLKVDITEIVVGV